MDLPLPETDHPKRATSIIGGMFGLESAVHPQEGSPPFLTGREVFLNCGRSCIWLLVDILRPPQVWVPSYLCPAGILGAIDTKVTVPRFFEVDRDLKVPSDKWIPQVNSGDLVIFIDYFGFPYDRRLATDVKKMVPGLWKMLARHCCQRMWGNRPILSSSALSSGLAFPTEGYCGFRRNVI